MKKLTAASIVSASVSLAALVAWPATAQSPQTNQPEHPSGQETSLSMDAVPNLNEDKLRRVQQALHNKGFDAGPLDGVLGPKTEEAVRGFQERYGMKATARIDNQTLYALGMTDLAGQPAGEPDKSSH